MTDPAADIGVDRCPLCASTCSVTDSIPEPNLYSEKLAILLDQEEDRVLHEHRNWRCVQCGLVFKRRWFADSVIRELFSGVVGAHPKGWDAVLPRFSVPTFRRTVQRWERAVSNSATPEIRRGERELLSIVQAISEPSDFDRTAVAAAIRRGDVAGLLAASDAIAASIGTPIPFTRFSGFRSREMWDYLQDKAGGFRDYAEVGCPLWGLLPLAAASGADATYLLRSELNYWGATCISAGERCTEHLLRDSRIGSADWSDRRRYPVIGVFQYLDHPRTPSRFLRELFGKADAAAVILDAVDSPVAIQHVTGWTEAALAYVARKFDKSLHTDFDDIRPSGNRLYLLAERR